MNDLTNFGLDFEPLKEGRFIQLYIEGKPFFRAGANPHPLMLEITLIQAGVRFDKGLDNLDRNSPIIKDKRGAYDLVGAGKIDGGKQIGFVLYDFSKSYGLTPNQEHLEDLTPYLPDGFALYHKDTTFQTLTAWNDKAYDEASAWIGMQMAGRTEIVNGHLVHHLVSKGTVRTDSEKRKFQLKLLLTLLVSFLQSRFSQAVL